MAKPPSNLSPLAKAKARVAALEAKENRKASIASAKAAYDKARGVKPKGK